MERCPDSWVLDIRWSAAFVDVSDSGPFGLALVHRIRTGQPACRIAAFDWVKAAPARRRLVRALELGADEFLGKPVSPPLVEALLMRLEL